MVNNTVNTSGFEALTRTNRSSNRENRTEDRSFDSFFSGRDNVARQPERQNAARPDGQRDNRSSRRVDNVVQTVVAHEHEQPVQPAMDGEMEAMVAHEEAALSYEAVEQVMENPEIALVLLEDEVLAEIAAILGITVQALTEVLNALGMTPVDLQEGHAQAELLQLLHGLDDEVALLNLPAALPIMQEISKTMEKYAPVLLEYQAELQAQPQYATVEEVVLADMDISPDSEFVPTARMVQDAPEVELPAEIEVTEAVTTTATATAESTVTIANNAEPLPTLEPLVAFAQATEQPVESFVRAAPVAAPVPQAPVSPQMVMDQIVQHMRYEVRGDITEVRIQLKPEHLGEVALRVAMQNGIVVAQFIAENQRVKEIIESNFNQLRDALEEQGINISEIEVSVAQGEADQQFAFESNVSGNRIQQLMEDGLEEETEQGRLEENIVDYLA